MAGNNRSERQLMRQRGAGARDVSNVEFGFKFGVRDSREDRQLMRQRGAGNRNVTNIDFGFSFPTPNQSRRSSRTPQTARRSSERQSRTPGSRKTKQSPVLKSVTKQLAEPLLSSSQSRKVSTTPQPISRGEQPNSGKRRRLNRDAENLKPDNIIVNLPPRRPDSGNTNFSIAEEDEAPLERSFASENANFIPQSQFPFRHSESPLFVPQDDDKENHQAEPKSGDWTAKSNRRRPFPDKNNVYNSPPPDTLPDHSIVESIEDEVREEHNPQIDAIENEKNITASIDDMNRNSRDMESANEVSLTTIANSDLDSTLAIGAKPLKRRKKRKSIIRGPKKRRSLESRASSILHADRAVPEEASDAVAVGEVSAASQQQQGGTESESSENELAKQRTPLWKKLAKKRAEKRRTRLSVSASPASRKAADEDSDGSYIEEDGSPEPITPALKKSKISGRKGISKARATSQVDQSNNANRKTFPITTYRITNAAALPTIVEEIESGSEASEPTNAPPATFSTRVQPNAVDVLAQICRESIQSAIEHLGESSSATNSRTELKQKRTALEAFGQNLDQRLFEMSEAVEHRMTLEARLRKSKREMAELQARWLEVRRQRDDIALKADMIRRQNWETEEDGKRQWEVSELAHQTDLALDSNDFEHADLEYMLKEVADQVSSVGSQGGILGRIRTFNKRLEKIATALEAEHSASM